MSNYKLLYITCGSKIEAINLGKLLVKNKLAACTNVIPNIKSIFNWKNKVTDIRLLEGGLLDDWDFDEFDISDF